ncbi:hippocampus abundant transcript 1 protein [Octopus bimaculoides]|uniref:hippocampus abundant transcript 1 protein n=1 Tax=Octopus bimaculoides TaxID=37653 RepID=UPI00071C209D|nr:hippocampus abundant transcript 1 protein [Octopus bimaculoides]|eukprot:XP_014778356.1 PREDICTED: hippocampus abundant transcript 1 protein-like [Octopus bimaculoides]
MVMTSKKKKRAPSNANWSRKNAVKDNDKLLKKNEPTGSKNFEMKSIEYDDAKSGLRQPSIYHALVIIFLEFFCWGLLTSPIIKVLNDTFPDHTFLMNGLIQGVKGMLSFLSAPLIGALSDVWGRKPFLILTVSFTCAPIPLMKISPWWYFAILSMSGIFAVTFSVVFAYVADVTSEEERSVAYGLSLKKLGKDRLILMLCVAVFLSYLPEAGEYSCFFVYLRLVMGFSAEEVASFIAVVGVLSVVAQTLVLTLLMRYLGYKHAIMFGLVFEMVQLACYGFGSQTWIVWCSGAIAAMSSITYPAISSFVSAHVYADQQGVAQGMVTGIRGLCNGLGPALYGFIFYLFHVDLNDMADSNKKKPILLNNSSHPTTTNTLLNVVPGPPFAFGAILVILALLVTVFIPDNPHQKGMSSPTKRVLTHDSFSKDLGSKKYEKEPLMVDSDIEIQT